MNHLTSYKHRVFFLLSLASWVLSLESSTFVENALQITPFLCKTNPILSAVGGLQMNVSAVLTKDYENETLSRRGKNKPNTNPIQTQYKANQTQLPKG